MPTSSAGPGFEPGPGFVVLDGDPGPGGAWQHRWPTLRFDAAHRLYPLPGFALGPVDADQPAADVVAEYYGDFERYYDLPIHRPVMGPPRVRSAQTGPAG